MHTEFWWGDLRGKRSLERPRRRLENNIKMEVSISKIERHDVDYSGSG